MSAHSYDEKVSWGDATIAQHKSRAEMLATAHTYEDFDPGHVFADTHIRLAGVEPSDSTDQRPHDTQSVPVRAVDLDGYRVLRIAAEMFHDTQKARIRLTNRAGRYAKAEGTPDRHVIPEWLAYEIATAEEAEHRLGLVLRRQFRAVAPKGLIAWQKATTGIGIDVLARVLGHLGHPRLATPYHWEGTGAKRHLVEDEPYERTVSELWQYCGHGAPGRPTKGMSAEELFALGNPTLKMLVHVMAECAVKQPGRHIADLLDPGQHDNDTQRAPAGVDPSTTEPIANPTPIGQTVLWPYRAAYEQRRLDTVDRLHNAPCVRCGPAGHPGQPGAPWSDGHAHADALRIVGKTILRDMWKASAD